MALRDFGRTVVTMAAIECCPIIQIVIIQLIASQTDSQTDHNFHYENSAGYYTVIINPKFRVLVVNTNYCARLNIWTYFDPIDPANQLSWLVDQLMAAEAVGAKVHIVGHVPVDDRECTQAYVFNYLAVVERFSDIIVGQFFGHTHADELRVLYSNDNKTNPIGFEMLSPSLTTFDSFNPAYRIVTVSDDGKCGLSE